MNKRDAHVVAEILGGKVEHTGGNIWVVRIDRGDGRVVIVMEEGASQFASARAWENGRSPAVEILFV